MSGDMFLKKSDPHLLIVGMTGVKMGDAFLQIGCADGGRMAAVAAKVGLSGRAAVVTPDEASAGRAPRGGGGRGGPRAQGGGRGGGGGRDRGRPPGAPAARRRRLRSRRRRRH